MKKLIYTTALVLFAFATNAQINWQKGGNNATPPGQPATIGTNATWNSPLGFLTNGVQRIYVDNTTGGVLGNVGIGSLFNSTTFRPFSLLHIAQDNVAGIGGGSRNWMAPSASGTANGGTGVMISNGDNVWLGLQSKGIWDANDAVLSWGDNGGAGKDFFRFVLTNWSPALPGGTNAGLEVMRFDPVTSYVGIGDFQINNQLNPLSKLHIHEDISLHPGGTAQSVWFQMTNHDFAPTPTANDGLRIGVLFQNAGPRTGNAFIYNQENRHLIFSTNHATPDGPGSINSTNERMRITSIGAPTTLSGGGYGVFNPSGTANTDFTRVAISLNPNNPIQRPLSLVHLGYQATGVNFDGWRPWMDIGTFTNSHFGSSMYSGLKQSGTNDAVIGWGYVPSDLGFTATRMRFLFTTNTTGTTAAAGANGIEAAHFWSDGNNTRMGVGDMQTTNVDPQNTLEIRSSTASPYFTLPGGYGSSGLRFTNLLSTHNPVPNGTNGVDNTKLLTVDKFGDVVLTNNVLLGNACGSTQNFLQDDWEIPMQNFNWYFTGQNSANQNSVAVGYPCSSNLPGKFNVYEYQPNYIGTSSFAGHFINDNQTPASVTNRQVGVYGQAIRYEQGSAHWGGYFTAWGGRRNAGVVGVYENTNTVPYLTQHIGGLFLSQPVNPNSNSFHVGVLGMAANSAAGNFGVVGRAPAPTGTSTTTNINYAGYFNGGVFYTQLIAPSDKNLKTEIKPIDQGLQIISRLNPVSYLFSNEARANGLSLPFNRQYGFVAQEVSKVIPDLVVKFSQAGTYDSLGNVLTPDTAFLGLDYNGFIGVLASAVQELNTKVEKVNLSDEQVKTNVNSFNALSKVKQLSPVSYNYTNSNVPQLSFKPNMEYGFVAQQLETIYPELIDTVRISATTDSLGNPQNPSVVLKTVNYKAMSALLTRAVQEQQLTIDSLKQVQNSQDSINNSVQNQLAQLTALMNSCCQNTSARTNTAANNSVVDVELSDKDIIVLNQNVPNPFAEQTTIAYNVPEKAGFAQIIFNDLKGQIIKVVDIKAKGKGQLNVFANDLITGMYTYSLYVDGKLIDTKKMVKTE